MSDLNVFVTKSDTAVIECPKCQKRKSISVASHKGKKYSTTVKCSCKNIFTIHLDFRQYYRKSTSLDGRYQKKELDLQGHYEKIGAQPTATKQAKNRTVNCTICDISIGGISMQIIGKHLLKVGDKLRVEFELDNNKKTQILREVSIKSINDNNIGAEFTNTHDSDAALGFYLMP
jgi:hypothetical protein